MKTITTGTKITFTETGDKFELIQTATGFDVKPIKLSKNIPTEPYTFQEFLDLYESGKITIQGFEEADAALIKPILINHIHTTEIEALKADITRITGEKEVLQATNTEFSSQLQTTNQQITDLTNKASELEVASNALKAANDELTASNKKLTKTNAELNKALEAMSDEKEA